MVVPLIGAAAAAAAARIAANKALASAAKREVIKKATLKNSKIVTIQGKKYTVDEAKVLSKKLRALQEVSPLKPKNQKILDEIKKLPKKK